MHTSNTEQVDTLKLPNQGDLIANPYEIIDKINELVTKVNQPYHYVVDGKVYCCRACYVREQPCQKECCKI
jgi:hypothetical protein